MKKWALFVVSAILLCGLLLAATGCGESEKQDPNGTDGEETTTNNPGEGTTGGGDTDEPGDVTTGEGNQGGETHTHVFGEWTTVTEATCTAEGQKERVCACGEKETVSIAMTEHVFENHICSICGMKLSEGLQYAEDENGGCIVAGLGECTDSVLLIPSDYDGKSVVGIGDKAFANCENLTSVVIPSSVSKIGEKAFSECSNLASITIPDNVTSIGYDAFHNTAYYKDEANWTDDVLYIGHHLIKAASGTPEVYTIKDGTKCIGTYAFYSRSKLTSIVIPNSVVSIDNMAFYGCSGLTSMEIPSSVTSIGEEAFYECENLVSITIPDGVTSIGEYAFYNCTALASITLPNGLTSIEKAMFYQCSGLTSVTIPSSVTYIGDNAFDGCESLTGVIIPDSVTDIGSNAFCNGKAITSMTIGSGVKNIGFYALCRCQSLTSITFTGTQAQWNAISKGSDWDYDTGAYVIHCTDGEISK